MFAGKDMKFWVRTSASFQLCPSFFVEGPGLHAGGGGGGVYTSRLNMGVTS